jgi:hypothetical protein
VRASTRESAPSAHDVQPPAILTSFATADLVPRTAPLGPTRRALLPGN